MFAACFRWFSRFRCSPQAQAQVEARAQRGAVLSAGAALSEGAALLFRDVKSRTTNEEKEQLFRETGFVLYSDKTMFTFGDGTTDFPFSAHVFPLDLNGDGTEEIFISWGNGFSSGMAGASISLFIRDGKGIYRANLGFPGLPPDLLRTGYSGLPDLVIGLPGFKQPVWRWNGINYEHLENLSLERLETLPKTNAVDLSLDYCSSLDK